MPTDTPSRGPDRRPDLDPDAVALGERLRALRAARGLSLRALAARLGISASAVSQIERGARRPSVSRLLTMVQALDASVTDVFDERAGQTAGTAPPEGVRPAVVVGRAGGSAPVTLEGGVVFRRLSPGPLDGADLFESTYPPGALATGVDELVTHAGYEVGTVSTGELTIDFPDERVVLRAGDSVTFPCDLPHRLGNLGEVAAVATWLIVHP